MKKTVPIICYLLGWIYPLSANIVSVLDVRLKLKLMGPFDFGNDSIMFYMFWSFIFAVITFGVFFCFIKIRFHAKFDFYFTFANIPIYIVSTNCGLYSDTYPWVAVISLVLAVFIISYTIFVTVKKTTEK